jgi:hypothetical protein
VGKADRDPEGTADPVDLQGLIQRVLRESYQETALDLRYHADKVRSHNQQKRAVRNYLIALRDFERDLSSSARDRGIDACGDAEDERVTALFEELSSNYESSAAADESCLPARVPPPSVKTKRQLRDEMARWEAQLNSIGDDAQIANIDLQNLLQRQQQTLAMMSNIAKMSHDTAMAIIRKLGG